MKKILLAHPGRQHSFKVASELKKNGMLFKYITTVYDKESSMMMKLSKLFISGDNLKRAHGRKNSDLSDEDIVQYCEFGGFVEILLARYDKKRKLYNWWQEHNSDRFGKKVAKFAIKNKVDAVILYDTNALKAFSILEKECPSILRIMDVSAANRIYMKTIYERDFSCCPQFADKLKNERSFLWKQKTIQRLEDEIRKTQYFLVPSKFVKESLMFSGINDNQIAICPYGANFSTLEPKKYIKQDGPIEAVYVGNVTEMKGIYYLLEAASGIDRNVVHLTVVGAYDNSDEKLSPYMEQITFMGRVAHERVLEILKRSDIFVFPSLGEGLSLSVLEALACGLPCIVTKNSGANDAIIEGKNGFVVDIQNSSALQQKMLWFASHREFIPEMSADAIKAIERFNWRNHEMMVIKALNSWLEK